MLISTKSRYGLRALCHLAFAFGETTINLSEISEREKVPIRYLEQIFLKLRAGEIVKGKRGPGGGYVLSRPPEEISLYDIISVLETNFLTIECIQENNGCHSRGHRAEEKCILMTNCLTRPLWHKLRNMYHGFLAANSIMDLAEGKLND